MDNVKIFAMIPARIGSKRLKMKNLALLNGKPLISYAINSARKSGMFDRIILNSDHKIFNKIAQRYEVEFYQRPSSLGSSITKSDDVVIDFIEKYPCDVVVWVNPTSPLQTGGEVREVVRYFLKKGLDSLITVRDEKVHCVYKESPINFGLEEVFAQTQDITPVQLFVYSIMMWRTETFRQVFKERGFAFFCGKTGFFPISKSSSFVIKCKEDLMIADCVMRATAQEEKYVVKYDKLVDLIEGD